MSSYFKLYSWMLHCLGTKEFTIDDFKKLFTSPQPAKVLHDLAKLGFIERIKRGSYIMRDPYELTRAVIDESERHISALEQANEKPYAFSHTNAIRIWTDGKHQLGTTDGCKPVHLAVLEDDLDWWREFFTTQEVKYCLENENKTLFGVVYILHPRSELAIERLYDMPVIPLSEVVAYCEQDLACHGEALEHLRERYRL